MTYDWWSEPGRQAELSALINAGMTPTEAMEELSRRQIAQAMSGPLPRPAPMDYSDPRRFTYEDRRTGTSNVSDTIGGTLVERLRVPAYADRPYREPEPRTPNPESVATAQRFADERDSRGFSDLERLMMRFGPQEMNREPTPPINLYGTDFDPLLRMLGVPERPTERPSLELNPRNAPAIDQGLQLESARLQFAPRSEIFALQRALTEAGYDPGPIDGYYGNATRAAYARYYYDQQRGEEE